MGNARLNRITRNMTRVPAGTRLSWILVALGIALLIAGGFVGDYGVILANARTICLSCMGIQ
ncbi:MAG: hypothetical protein BWY85_01125 [Firmicutes bacterium ADurb.Bin506]|jgi:nitrate reductase NapE component|nr:MAG: hypothetical protein BWY85_01125 [Firmicutes bacterium ADurb.Bin506]